MRLEEVLTPRQIPAGGESSRLQFFWLLVLVCVRFWPEADTGQVVAGGAPSARVPLHVGLLTGVSHMAGPELGRWQIAGRHQIARRVFVDLGVVDGISGRIKPFHGVL